jgi:hypothetical protein
VRNAQSPSRDQLVAKMWKAQQKEDLPKKEQKDLTTITLKLAGYDEGTQLHFVNSHFF